MSQKINSNCCYATFDKMHALCDTAWFGTGLLLASPFALLIPKNPAANVNGLAAHGMMQLKGQLISTLVQRVHTNQKLPSFVDTVKAMEGIKYGKLCEIALLHALEHRKDPPVHRFWSAIGNAYCSKLIQAARRQNAA